MKTSLQDYEIGSDNSVHKSVFLSDAPGPNIIGPVFEPLGLSTSFTRRAKRVVDQSIDALQEPTVIELPPLVVFPTGLIEDESHSRSSSRAV